MLIHEHHTWHKSHSLGIFTEHQEYHWPTWSPALLFSKPGDGRVFSRNPYCGGVTKWNMSWSGWLSGSVASNTPPHRHALAPSSTTNMLPDRTISVSSNIGSNHFTEACLFFFLRSVSKYFSSSSNLQAAPLAPFFPHACYATSLTLPLFPCTPSRLLASPLPPGCW